MDDQPSIYQTDAYARQFRATVTRVAENGDAVVLDRTAFYPGGGGQPHDTGWLHQGATRIPVSRLRRDDGELWHVLEAPGNFAPGVEVEGEIDWERRHQLMRTHTAMHILCGVVWRDYGAQVTGGNMQPLRGRLDFEFERMSADLVGEIERKINVEVAADREVRVRILPRAEAFEIPDLIRTKVNLLPPELTQIRTVEIVGLDLQADGGTHVARTSEVGALRIAKYKSKGRINKRIEVEVG